MRDRAVQPLRALAMLVSIAGGACSLTDLDGLAVGTSDGGGDTTSTVLSASSGETSSASGSGGGVSSSGSSSSSTTSTATTGVGTTTGTGGDGGGGAGGGSDPCLEGQICRLVDDFADGSALWATYGICDTSDTEGVMEVRAEPIVQTASYCGYFTTAVYDFRGGSVVVAVDEVTTDGFGVQTYLNVDSADQSATVSLVKSNGALTFADRFLVEHDPVQQRFWRVADRDGALVLSVHPADPDADWVELMVVEDHGVTLDTVRVALGVGTFANNDAPGRAIFDCVNVPLEDCPPP